MLPHRSKLPYLCSYICSYMEKTTSGESSGKGLVCHDILTAQVNICQFESTFDMFHDPIYSVRCSMICCCSFMLFYNQSPPCCVTKFVGIQPEYKRLQACSIQHDPLHPASVVSNHKEWTNLLYLLYA